MLFHSQFHCHFNIPVFSWSKRYTYTQLNNGLCLEFIFLCKQPWPKPIIDTKLLKHLLGLELISHDPGYREYLYITQFRITLFILSLLIFLLHFDTMTKETIFDNALKRVFNAEKTPGRCNLSIWRSGWKF